MGLGSEQRVLEQMLQAKESLQKGIEDCDRFIDDEGFKGLIIGLKSIENAIEVQKEKVKELKRNNRPCVIIQNNLSNHIDK